MTPPAATLFTLIKMVFNLVENGIRLESVAPHEIGNEYALAALAIVYAELR